MRVILIDDEKGMLIILKRLLSRMEGVTIMGSFLSGADALDWVRLEETDIAFVDIQMPGKGGIGLAKQLQAIRPDLGIVFVTSHREYAVDAFDLGAVDYIVKPVQYERLEQTIHRIARRRTVDAESGDDAADRLKACCLGGLSVSSRCGDVKWISGKSAELFAYLLMHRDKGAARYRILEDLFDDMPKPRADVYLNTAVYQLRKVLKIHGLSEAVISLNERYKLHPESVDADFVVFEERVMAIGEIAESNYKQAYETEQLYTGDLFEEKAYLWSMTEKERLFLLYSRFAKRLGEWLLVHGHIDWAAQVIRKLAAHNETDEEANALLLRVYAAAKDRQSLIVHYNSYVNLLQEEFDVRPGIEITRLFERLKDELSGV